MRAARITCLILILLSPVHASGMEADDDARAWQIARMVWSQNGRRIDRGLVIYSTDAQRSGAAFRCDRGKLYAIFSLEGVPIGRYMTLRSTRPRDIKMVVQIDGSDARTEKWVSMFNGKLYMARSLGTTSELYRAVAAGDPVILARRPGQPVTVEYPSADQSLFENFLAKCNLNRRHAPYAPNNEPSKEPRLQTE